MFSNRSWASGLVAVLLVGALVSDCSAQAVRKITGTFNTPVQQGAFTFTSVKAVRVVNRTAYQGKFVIAGKSYPGTVLPTPTGLSMVWYYGVTGITAGQAFVTAQAAPTYVGDITFWTRSGTMSSTGSLSVALQ